MTDDCPAGFDQTLLTAWLDHELTQQQEQRLELHLESCEGCRRLADELAAMRETTMTTRFELPQDSEWGEAPRTAVSRAGRGAGWTILVVWVLVAGGFGLVEAWRGAEDLGTRLLVFGGLSGLALLLVSVAIDRLRAARSDRYREVQR